MYEDILEQFNSLSETSQCLLAGCDLKLELERIKKSIYENFVLEKQPAIYQPSEFIEFCSRAGAPNVFNHILKAISDDRHSHRRQELNRVRTVSIIYTMCYCRSQMCNVMQVDHALYLNSNRVTQEGIDTQHRMGHTCSRKTSNIIRSQLSRNHAESLNSFFDQAIQNEWVLVLIIDDFTKVHTYRRPSTSKTCNPMSMCTIVVKAFKQLKAIKAPANISRIHCPEGVNIKACVDAITSSQQLTMLGSSYASTMPNWLTSLFFTPDLQRHILEEHGYSDESGVRLMRTMDDLHLIDFVELQLKSKDGFSQAYKIAMPSGLSAYLKKFIIIQPGDWPCQFYCRQLVYESLSHCQEPTDYQEHESSTSTVEIPAITSLIPTMGPLHISLNSREDIFESFKPFFNQVYNHLFPNSKMPKSPKPWKINLILETVYGGWTLIREQVATKFQYSKDIQYGALLNLLDNYLPLVLTIYSITFKRNNFSEYYNAMIRIWVMFLCLKRRHYNKAPLVWLSNISHWKSKFSALYEQFSTWPTIFDEYPVENTHSIIRAQTQPTDTAEKLQQRAKSIFQSKTKQANFRSNFTPPKQFNYSQQQLKYLMVKCAEFLTNIFIAVNNHIGCASSFIKRKVKYVYLPDIFGPDKVKYTTLPLGFSSSQEPNQDCICDLYSCTINHSDEPWKLFQGCWHSFHVKCLNGSDFCPICHGYLQDKVKELGNIAKDAILNQKINSVSLDVDPDKEPDDEPDNMESMPLVNVDQQGIDKSIKELSVRIENLQSAPKPANHHPQQAPATPVKPDATKNNQHNKRKPLHDIQNLDHVVQQQQQLQQQQQIPKSTNRMIEWLFPANICQTRVGGRPMASNACTIIASLWCRKFLLKKIAFPSNESDIRALTNSYKGTIVNGNLLYQGLNLPADQPNLEVRDVVNRIKDLRLNILQDLGFFNVNELKETFVQMLQEGKRRAGVLIMPPASSVAIIMENGNLAVFDSHQHGGRGSLVLVCKLGEIDYLLNYIEKTQKLCGSNFAELATIE
ncbi:uncharacterized protein LOC114533084 [Dendronephthya gigantea]|uniref:uncharacterized protein LOC114533084 n=1 Tax=Dendronephthya gigantea TaxID=151771 RepID=UPI00106B9C7C|nr:uncharacterized protein LOC114533084 [Dendronephthya gigantea]